VKTIICQDRLGTHTQAQRISFKTRWFVFPQAPIPSANRFPSMVDAVQQHVTTATHVKGVNGVTSNDTSGITNASAVAKVSGFPCTYIYCPWPGPVLAKHRFSLLLVSSRSWGPSLVYDEQLETEALVCVLQASDATILVLGTDLSTAHEVSDIENTKTCLFLDQKHGDLPRQAQDETNGKLRQKALSLFLLIIRATTRPTSPSPQRNCSSLLPWQRQQRQSL
jgi:hypothetical protein